MMDSRDGIFRHPVTRAVLAVLLLAASAAADHHPIDLCGPSMGGTLDNCSRGGEPQNHTFYAGRLASSGVVSVPIRLNTKSDQLCEIGVRLAYDSSVLSWLDMRFHLDAMTPDELDRVFSHDGGTFTPGNTPVPSISAMDGVSQSHALNPDLDAPECPTCDRTVTVRLWAYTDNVPPMMPLGDSDRTLLFVDFGPAIFSEVGDRYQIVQQDAWITELAEGGDSCKCQINHAAQGPSCDPAETVMSWPNDLADGSETNQVEGGIECWSADFNWDGGVGGPDYGIFVNAFNALFTDPYRELRPDCNGDGGVGGPDYGCFIERYQTNNPDCEPSP